MIINNKALSIAVSSERTALKKRECETVKIFVN